MTKKTLFWAILSVLLVYAGSAMAGGPKITAPVEYKILDGSEPFPNVPYFPSQPGLLTDTVMVGETQYDYQSNGSMGRRVVVDSQGGVHFSWMRAIQYAPPMQREVWFNYVSPSGSWLGATSASQANMDGYVQMTISSDDRAALAFHRSGTSTTVWFALDTFSGVGVFDYFPIPNNPGGTRRCLWPYITRDHGSRYQVIFTDTVYSNRVVYYTRSTNDGAAWSTMARVDTVQTLSTVIVSSPVSDKVAIVYNHPSDAYVRNNVYYIQSADGLTWNFASGKVNVTNYNRRDSLYAYNDLAAAYDYNDDLHIVWNACYFSADNQSYYPTWTYLNHYDIASGIITLMETAADSFNWISGCASGAGSLPISKMSLGIRADNSLYVAYTRFDTTDCSAGGFANGDIYMMKSFDSGRNWDLEENLTNSHTPGCQPGDCDSDHWSTIAEKVDDNVHIFFENDKDAGSIVQNEGTITDNPMMYIKIPSTTGIDDNINTPRNFSLKQNYPNPFNAQTNIDFTLEKNSKVELAVYNLLGAKVATLVKGQMDAGAHSVNFDASKVSSGIYYYTLKTDGSAVTKKMTLMK